MTATTVRRATTAPEPACSEKDNIVSDSGDRGKRPGGQRPGGNSGGSSGGGRHDSGRPNRGQPDNGRPDRPPRPTGSGDSRPDYPRRDNDARPPRDGDSRPRRDNDARPPRPSGSGDRPYRPAGSGDRPYRSAGSGDSRPDRPRRDNDSRPPRSGDSRDGRSAPRDGERRLWTAGGAPARGNFDASERETPEDRDPFNTRSVRAHHEAPEIPEGVEPSDLDRVARNELKTLSKENADGVALHLVMAASLIEEDPALAHQHAISAARRAGRIGVVRETLAITAYAVGDFALALRELRTHRRITGSNDQLPMMVDSERGMGRPDKALELGRSVPRASLPVPVQVELAIAMSGARLDLEQLDAALTELQIPQLDPNTAFSYSPALFDAYATVLEELGRDDEAEVWFERSTRASQVLDNAEHGDDGDMIEIVEEDLPEEYLSADELAAAGFDGAGVAEDDSPGDDSSVDDSTEAGSAEGDADESSTEDSAR